MTFLAIIGGLIAPFGGFFASAYKRYKGVKDFSDLIPGHGGVTDRLDCILVMVLFMAIYLEEIIKPFEGGFQEVLITI